MWLQSPRPSWSQGPSRSLCLILWVHAREHGLAELRAPHLSPPCPGSPTPHLLISSAPLAGDSDLLSAQEGPSRCPSASAGSRGTWGHCHSSAQLVPYCHPSHKESLGTALGILLLSCSPFPGSSSPWPVCLGHLGRAQTGPGDERGQCLSQSDRVSSRGDAAQEWPSVPARAQEGVRGPGNIPASLFRVGKQP